MTLEEMERRMSARELTAWQQLFAYVIPFPDPVAQMAMIRCTIATALGSKAKPQDFMPKPPLSEGREQTPEEVRSHLGREAEV